MPHAIVAGVPSAWARQIRAALDKTVPSGWSFSVFPAINDKTPGIDQRQLQPLFAEAEKRFGAHIFGVGDRDRQLIAANIRTYFRFRWLPSDLVRLATANAQPLIAEVERVIIEENAWRDAVYPVAKNSPLALPQHGFVANKSVASLWDMCESFNKEEGFFATVTDRAQRFKGLHLKKWDRHNERFFIDDKLRVWKDDGPYHGEAPFPRDWKYSSALPKAFHFDVQHTQGRAFEYSDRKGYREAISAEGHCNVDAHGYLRS